MELLGTWIAAFLTLCIFSFLYRDNPFFRFAESVFAGVSLGYYVGQEASQTIAPNLVEPLFGDFANNIDLVIPALVGVNLYTRYIPKINWWARWSLAIYVGYFVGVNMVQKLHGEVLPQMQNTIVPFTLAGGWMGLVQNAVLLIGVLAVLMYFFFSLEHKGVVGGASRLGVWYLMIGFGAAFGYTVMGRVSLLIGRMDFLINRWFLDTLRSIGIL
ncbi:MAG: hypothetical protein GF346_12685 [Candidatus Eisenbacteria bacterium]|nr:hypothetical protein [Candidatus Latescibacterota bacterium]MBD3303293.1 hypothetical protein [Candidatus Eisenbacteria bacterium]